MNTNPPSSPKTRYFFSAANPEEFRKLFGGSIIHNVGGSRGAALPPRTSLIGDATHQGILARVSDEQKRVANRGGVLLDSPRSAPAIATRTRAPAAPSVTGSDDDADLVLCAKVSDITDRRWLREQRRRRKEPIVPADGVANPPPDWSPSDEPPQSDTPTANVGLHPLDPKFKSWMRRKSAPHLSLPPAAGGYHIDPTDGSLVYHDSSAPLPPPTTEANVSVQNLRDVISSEDEDSEATRPIIMGQLLARRVRELEREEMAEYAAHMLAMGRRGGSASAYIEASRRKLLPVERRSFTSSVPTDNRRSIKGCDDMERIDRLIMETMDPSLCDYGDPLDVCVPHSGGELPGAESWATVDRLGFPVPPTSDLLAADRAAQAGLRQGALVCDQHWNSALKGVTLLGSATVETCDALRKLARKYGTPTHLRSLLWMTLSGVSLKMDENDGFFKAIIGKFGLMSGVSQETIEKDLERTFPDHPYFTPGEPGVHRLRLILHALCWRHPLLGYCQSFNFMAAVLLLVTDDDEATFFIMCHVLEDLLPNDYYSDGLMGVKVDQEALVGLLVHSLPKVAEHFHDIRFDVRALVPAWLMSLFVNTFPIETVLRIWDCLITENHVHYSPIPLSVLIAFLKIHQEEILRCEDAGELMVFLNRASTQEYDSHRLIKTAVDLGIKHSELHHIRRKVRETILVDAEKRKKDRIEMLEKRRLQKEAQAALPSQQIPNSPSGGNEATFSSDAAAAAAFAIRDQNERDERNKRLKEISPNYYHNSMKSFQAPEAPKQPVAVSPQPLRRNNVQEMEEFSRCDGEDTDTVMRLAVEANRVAQRTSVIVAKGGPPSPSAHPAPKPRQAESVDNDNSGRASPVALPATNDGEPPVTN